MSETSQDVRALRRGLQVIDYIARRGSASLADLNRGTGLAKSTLRRLLATLEDENFVRRSLADGLFRANVSVPSQSHSIANPEHARIALAARPVLEGLARKVVWPSDLFVRSGFALTVLDHNRSLTPLLVNRDDIGDRVDMSASAVGRAYLAFCPPAESEEVLVWIEKHRGKAIAARTRTAVLETRERGYGLRDPSFTGATHKKPMQIDRLKAVALPVISSKRVICCINMLWPAEASAAVGKESEIVTMLRDGAAQIAAGYEKVLSPIVDAAPRKRSPAPKKSAPA
ncbi:MAG: helix-turn-helix domain-containing protein [Alphaproteobacteria bacterium]|nr:helix-turn-helix domain-containing protein [Alphaproteobacteria bacterium]